MHSGDSAIIIGHSHGNHDYQNYLFVAHPITDVLQIQLFKNILEAFDQPRNDNLAYTVHDN